MNRKMGIRWHLRELMAAKGMFMTSELVPKLFERGVELSREQVYRLVTQQPERLSVYVLAGALRHPGVHAERPARAGGRARPRPEEGRVGADDRRCQGAQADEGTDHRGMMRAEAVPTCPEGHPVPRHFIPSQGCATCRSVEALAEGVLLLVSMEPGLDTATARSVIESVAPTGR